MIEYYLLKNDVEKLLLYIKKFSSSPKKYEKKLKEVYNQILISDKEMDNVLSPILGEEWRSYVKEYRKN